MEAEELGKNKNKGICCHEKIKQRHANERMDASILHESNERTKINSPSSWRETKNWPTKSINSIIQVNMITPGILKLYSFIREKKAQNSPYMDHIDFRAMSRVNSKDLDG